jgi:hypothetical protein
MRALGLKGPSNLGEDSSQSSLAASLSSRTYKTTRVHLCAFALGTRSAVVCFDSDSHVLRGN